MENIYEISAIIQRNNEDEAVAIKGYTELLDLVFKSDLTNESKEKIFASIKEIIADELNHQQKLQELYSFLTSIQPNID